MTWAVANWNTQCCWGVKAMLHNSCWAILVLHFTALLHSTTLQLISLPFLHPDSQNDLIWISIKENYSPFGNPFDRYEQKYLQWGASDIIVCFNRIPHKYNFSLDFFVKIHCIWCDLNTNWFINTFTFQRSCYYLIKNSIQDYILYWTFMRH